MTRLLPVDMASTLRELGLSVGRVTGDEVWALCPAHESRVGKKDSKATNFSVNVDTGLASCFACGWKTDITGIVIHVRQCSMWDASRWLLSHGASLTDQLERVQTKIAEKRERRGEMSPGVLPDDPDLNFVLFHDAPDEDIWQRDLDRDSVDHYSVRWDPMFDAWVLPMFGRKNRVAGWQLKAGSWVRNKPDGIKKSEFLFGEQVHYGKRLIVVESPLDAVKLHAAGIDGAVATFGSKVSHQQVRKMLAMSDHVTLAFDHDEAGWHATEWMLDRLRGRIAVEVVDYSEYDVGTDPGDLSDRALARLLRDAKSGLLWRSPAS